MHRIPLLLPTAALLLFAAACGDDNNGPAGPTTASIQVSVTSTGPADPTGYTVAVDGGSGQPITAGGTVTIPDVSAGPHTVTLGDLAPNCSTAAGNNPQTVTVAAGETAQVAFAVTCASLESPPAITSVTFPATVFNDPGTSVDLTIGFTDPDGDVAVLRYEEVSDPNDAITIDPDTEDVRALAAGRTSGTLTIQGAYTCADPDGCVTGPVTVSLRLRDEAGNESEPSDFSFEIVDPPTQLAFSVQPTDAGVGAAITPAVQVVARDAHGATATAFTGNVTVAIGTNPSGGTLAGTTTVAAVAGVANFDDLSIDNAGTGYTLAAAASNLAGATSAAFDITAVTSVTRLYLSPLFEFKLRPDPIPQSNAMFSCSDFRNWSVTLAEDMVGTAYTFNLGVQNDPLGGGRNASG